VSESHKTVLIVDDESTHRETLKLAIESWGYVVLLAENGAEAVTLYRLSRPDIILADMMMPRMGGLEMLRILKREEAHAKVILVTAHGRISDAVAAIKDGALDLLTKPVDFKKLKELVDCIHGEVRDPIRSIPVTNPMPAKSGIRPPEIDLTLRQGRPQNTSQVAGWMQSGRPAFSFRFGLPRIF
jgi:two-component system chemotaxis response regulator CheY